MRRKRIFDVIFLMSLFVVDFLIQSLFYQVKPVRFLFVSQWHFMSLLLFSKEEPRWDMVFKVALVAMIMDLNHVGSYPMYYLIYGISVYMIRIWYRHVGNSAFEHIVMMTLGIFLKELLLYFVLIFQDPSRGSFTFLVAHRSIWILIGNIILSPLLLLLFNKYQEFIANMSSRNIIP